MTDWAIPIPTRSVVSDAYSKTGSMQKAAAEMNVSHTTFRRWMKHYGIEAEKRGRHAAIKLPGKREFRKLYYSMTSKELAVNYGVSVSTIYKWRKALLPEVG